MHVVIVESPAKSKTINKYLGSDYTVLASYGHIRDLPSKDGSVRPDEDFSMIYELDADSKKRLSAIASATKGAESLILATDPDREGEAISWHVLEALKEKKALKKDTRVERVVFNAITRKAVTDAMKEPRELDMDLVNAQQARRALDYLVGFNLSPVLWRKLPGSRSAGRVQSVALRLICDRELEIERFHSQEYWTIEADMANQAGDMFKARLTHLDGEKLDKFSINSEASATKALQLIQGKNYAISSIEQKRTQRNPAPPFTTSTLQQEAARKLGFGAKKTMQIAQKLYEGMSIGGETTGLITYMRTDGLFVAPEAISEARTLIGKQFTDAHLPENPRLYKSKAKNSQEAHEAIRPTSVLRRPEDVAKILDSDQLKLYRLIWNRMVASQMASAQFDQVAAVITDNSGKHSFRATGSTLVFGGFIDLYYEGRDDEPEEDNDNRLPPLKEGESTQVHGITPSQHFTEPPPRFSEASLVKELEKLGIGRPSTYASIISVLQDRDYVRLDKKRFHPEMRGRIVTAFLVTYFPKYVEYDFTAELENSLDFVSEGKQDWKALLRHFWGDFKAKVDETMELSPPDILKEVEGALEHLLFSGEEGRSCPSCKSGTLNLKTGKFGAFLGCDGYPDCRYTKQLGMEEDEDAPAADQQFPIMLGNDEEGNEVSIRKGPYGVYVQLDDGGKKPKRSSLPKGKRVEDIDLIAALDLLALPRDIGPHPEDGAMIKAGVGRFGPYVQHHKVYASLTADDDVLTVGLNRAVALLDEKSIKSGAKPLRLLGSHPDDDAEVGIFSGRYGPYVKHGDLNASLPKGTDTESYTLEEAIKLLKNKGKAQASPAKKATKKKAPAKKKTTSKKAS